MIHPGYESDYRVHRPARFYSLSQEFRALLEEVHVLRMDGADLAAQAAICRALAATLAEAGRVAAEASRSYIARG